MRHENMARAIAWADPMGPDDFEESSDREKNMYDSMANAARNHAHKYAIHTLVSPNSLVAIASVSGAMTLYRDGDTYAVWGEHLEPGATEHLVIGTDDESTTRLLVRALDRLAVPADVTSFWDWSDDEDGPAGHTERDLGIGHHVSWSHWIRDHEDEAGL